MKPIIAVSFQTEDSEKAYSIRHRWIDYVEAIGAAAVMLVPANNFSSTERVLSCASGVLIPGGNDVDPKMYGQKPLAGTDPPALCATNLKASLLSIVYATTFHF